MPEAEIIPQTQTSATTKQGFIPTVLKGLAGNIPMVGSFIQSGIDAFVNNRNMRQQQRANQNLAQYQYSKDVEMWNKANEYNSPIKQMERLKSAGLSPAQIYGGGSASAVGNTATTLPKYSAPRVEYNKQPLVNVTDMLSRYQDFRMKDAQIDNVRSQKRLNDEKAGLTYLEQFVTDLERKLKDLDYKQKYRMKDIVFNTAVSEMQSAQHSADIRRKQNQIESKMLDARLQNIIGETAFTQEKKKTQVITNEYEEYLKSLGILGTGIRTVKDIFK